MRLNLHIYPSTFKFEKRIIQEVNSIMNYELADKIIIVAIWKEGYALKEIINRNIEVHRIKLILDYLPSLSIFKVFKFIELILRIVFKYTYLKPVHVNCHSISVLPLVFFFKLISRSKIIYDAHEFEIERVGVTGLRKLLSRWMEKLLMPFVDKVIVVNNSYKKAYQKYYPLKKFYVIRNVTDLEPEDKETVDLRTMFQIPSRDIIFIYQGLLSTGRGVEILIEAFKYFRDKHLVIMGFGPLQSIVENVAGESINIHFLNAVPPSKIKAVTKGADVGISLIENVCLSYYYSLPNKVFEYIHCDKPLIVSKFPEMSEIIDHYSCGWKVEPNKELLIELLYSIRTEEIKLKGLNSAKAKFELTWQRESVILKEVFS